MDIKWTDNVGKNLSRQVETGLSSLYHENSKIFPYFEFEAGAALYINPFELKISTRGFKKFKNADRISLPDFKKNKISLQEILSTRRSRRELSGKVSLRELAAILSQSLGITGIVQNEEQGLAQYLRAWPSAGGLYPLDVYVLASKTKGFEPGIYHFNVIENVLEKINGRPVALVLSEGFFRQEFIVSSAITIVFVCCFSRTKSKYGERGYRLALLDAGHAAQNVLLTCEQLRINAVPIAGFCDDNLANDLLLDGVDEAVIHCISLGKP